MAPCDIEAGSESRRLAEVAAKLDDDDFAVVGDDFFEELQGVIRAAVIDEDKLVIKTGCGERFGQAVVKLLHDGGFIVERHYDGAVDKVRSASLILRLFFQG